MNSLQKWILVGSVAVIALSIFIISLCNIQQYAEKAYVLNRLTGVLTKGIRK